MAHQSLYKFGRKTLSQIETIQTTYSSLNLEVGDSVFNTDWNMEMIYNGEFFMSSDMEILTNVSGSEIRAGELCKASTTTELAVTTPSSNDEWIIGMACYDAANNANVAIKVRGYWDRLLTVSTCDRGEIIYTDTTFGRITTSPTAVAGAIGVCIFSTTSGAETTTKAIVTNRREAF